MNKSTQGAQTPARTAVTLTLT